MGCSVILNSQCSSLGLRHRRLLFCNLVVAGCTLPTSSVRFIFFSSLLWRILGKEFMWWICGQMMVLDWLGSSSSMDIKCCFCPAFSFSFFFFLQVATSKLRLFKISGLGGWLEWDCRYVVSTDPQHRWNEENKWTFSKLEAMITRRYVSSSLALGSVGWGSTSSPPTQSYFMIKIGYVPHPFVSVSAVSTDSCTSC